jgi:tetratricopeptide (TPR) repeat protein
MPENCRQEPSSMPEYPSRISREAYVDPQPQKWVRRAERQARQGRRTQAVISLENAILAGADPYGCRLRIADLYRTMEEWNAALGAAEEAAALQPERQAAYELLMTIAIEAGDTERILAASNALIRLSPRHLLAFAAQSNAYLQLGDIDAAMRVTNNLIRLDPHTAAHRFRKAMMCQHKGEIGLAVQELVIALQLEPEGPYAEAAHDALQMLDLLQIDQIMTLASEDSVFRTKFLREPNATASEKGFVLSEHGTHLLRELSAVLLPELTLPCPVRYYN